MGILDKFRSEQPDKDEIRLIGDFLLAKYSFEEYCKFFKVNWFEAEKEYNAYQDRRSWLISEHEKRGGKVIEVSLYYDEYLAYLKKHELPDDENSKSLYMSSKPKLDMEKTFSGVHTEKLVKEFIELTKPDRRKAKVAVVQISQWLYDNWDSIDNDFLVLLSRYTRTLEVEGQTDMATRLIAHKQMIDALKTNPPAFAKLIIKAAISKSKESEREL